MLQNNYSSKSVASRMITSFPRASTSMKVIDVKNFVFKNAEEFDTLDYVYVVDFEGSLKGVISIKELHSAKEDLDIEKIMTKKLIVTHPSTPKERVVYLALSNKIKAIPVVDKEKRLLGIIPHDVILEIFNEEVREDVFKFGGIFHKVGKEYTTIKSSSRTMIKTRLPWLIIGVLGGTVTASIISGFEQVLNTLLVLAAFAPVLTYLSDAVGTQSETLVVRSLALEPKLSLKSYFARELIVAFSLALVCSLLLSVVALVGWNNYNLGAIVGLSMFLSVIAAVLISTGFPILFKKANLDPAVASGPFATMISDVCTIIIYFAVASILLSSFGLI